MWARSIRQGEIRPSSTYFKVRDRTLLLRNVVSL